MNIHRVRDISCTQGSHSFLRKKFQTHKKNSRPIFNKYSRKNSRPTYFFQILRNIPPRSASKEISQKPLKKNSDMCLTAYVYLMCLSALSISLCLPVYLCMSVSLCSIKCPCITQVWVKERLNGDEWWCKFLPVCLAVVVSVWLCTCTCMYVYAYYVSVCLCVS